MTEGCAVLEEERADYRSHVEAAIRQSTSGPHKVIGTHLAIAVKELDTGVVEVKEVEYRRSYLDFWLAESLLVEGSHEGGARSIGF